jgi:glycosyltransferase involved in cell wall biosynthesis
VAELCANLDRVRYVRFDDPISVGRKLNVGVEVSSGAVIQKLDDDDSYSPEFVRYAVEHLPANIDGGMLLAWDCFSPCWLATPSKLFDTLATAGRLVARCAFIATCGRIAVSAICR